MATDTARFAVKEQVKVAKFDHDFCGPERTHVCAGPNEITVGEPQWFIGGEQVTDPALIARLEMKAGTP